VTPNPSAALSNENYLQESSGISTNDMVVKTVLHLALCSARDSRQSAAFSGIHEEENNIMFIEQLL